VQARRLDDAGAALAGQLDRLLLARGAESTGASTGGVSTVGLNLRQLGIIRGEAAWALSVDCIVLAAGGSVLMALAAGIHKALQDTRLPRVSVDASIVDATQEDIEVDADRVGGVPLAAAGLPVLLSTCQVRWRAQLRRPCLCWFCCSDAPRLLSRACLVRALCSLARRLIARTEAAVASASLRDKSTVAVPLARTRGSWHGCAVGAPLSRGSMAY
jgi:3' exoribonuclease family, domain 1